MTRHATISPFALLRRNRALLPARPHLTADELLRLRDHLERQLARRPITVGQVHDISRRIDAIDRQLDAR